MASPVKSAKRAFLHAEMERSSSSIRDGSNPLAKSLRGRRRLSAPASATALSGGGGAAARAGAGGALVDVAERDAFERGQVPGCGKRVCRGKRRGRGGKVARESGVGWGGACV